MTAIARHAETAFTVPRLAKGIGISHSQMMSDRSLETSDE